MSYPSYYIDYKAVAIAFGEEIEGYEAEDYDDAHSDADDWGHRNISYGSKGEIKEYGGEPQPEMGKDMHHGLEYDG
jgi:hypothetical protein